MDINKENFIKKIASGTKDSWQKYSVLPSITIAQAVLESAWGTSELAKNANNLFGIKGGYNKYGYRKLTWEHIDGKDVSKEEWFKCYPSWDVSVNDYYQTFLGSDWRKDYYKNVIGEENYEKVAKALTGTYATDPKYATKLIEIIDKYGLSKYDPVFKKPEPVVLSKLRIGPYSLRSDASVTVDILKRGGIEDAWMFEEDGKFIVQAGAFPTQSEIDERIQLVNSILPALYVDMELK